jgi:hypothetical protein
VGYRPLKTYQELMKQGLTVHLDVDAPPGRKLAWLAVRDNQNGYVGTLQVPVGQQETLLNSFSLSL